MMVTLTDGRGGEAVEPMEVLVVPRKDFFIHHHILYGFVSVYFFMCLVEQITIILLLADNQVPLSSPLPPISGEVGTYIYSDVSAFFWDEDNDRLRFRQEGLVKVNR